MVKVNKNDCYNVIIIDFARCIKESHNIYNLIVGSYDKIMGLDLVQFLIIIYVQYENPTIDKFLAYPSQMTWTKLVWAFKTNSISNKPLATTFLQCTTKIEV
jgi:hypothetical protein